VSKAKPVMLAAACHIQEMLTATDPENAVAELDVDDTPLAAPVQPAPVPLTVEDVRKAGGIVHSDGNIFFTNLAQLNAAHGITKGGAA
jgi:hypothetical protein